jgi:hypothetical protein
MTRKNPNSKGDIRENNSNILEKFSWIVIYIYTFKKSVAKNTLLKKYFLRKTLFKKKCGKNRLYNICEIVCFFCSLFLRHFLLKSVFLKSVFLKSVFLKSANVIDVY